jgi:oligopeptidase A
MRQLSFATVDLALHRRYDPATDGDVVRYARGVMAQFSATPLPEDYAMIASFNHLFADSVGYAAGYYSYKWAEVLDADAFTRFEREGIFNRAVGADFRQWVLSKGDSEDPAALFRGFMGRDATVDALLARIGLTERAA